MGNFDINSFNDYVEFLKEFTERKNEELWYRGQINNSWRLEPNLYRGKVLDLNDGEISLLRYKVPDFMKEFDTFMNRITKENIFKQYKLNKFHIMFIGQHYGLLTPVVDWTTDPLAAIFFALDEFEYKNEEQYPVIYILNPTRCNKNSGYHWSNGTDIEEVICVDEDNISGLFDELIENLKSSGSHIPIALCSKKEYSFRISRQSGNFTFINPVQPLNFQWNDTVIDNEPLAKRITINPKAVSEILLCLKALGIKKETLYKNDHEELDKICQKIKDETINDFKKATKR